MKYPKYYSYIEAVWYQWLPENWQSLKMRQIFSERNIKVSDKDYPALSVGKMGVVPQLDTAVKTDNGDNRKLICKGDFAINSRSDRKGSGGFSEYTGSSSLIITVLRLHGNENGRFFHYLLRSHYFSEEFYRNGRGLVSDLWTTKWDTMRNIYIPVPPKAEQDQIVRYLDWKTSEINKLIHRYQDEIGLLREKEQSSICELVLHGSEDHKYCDSGDRFLGGMPIGWQCIRNKYIFRERSEYSETGKEDLLSVSKHYGVKKYSELKEDEQYATIKPAETLVGYKVVKKNDLVMNIMRARNGSYGISNYDGIVSPAYAVYKPVRECNPVYLHYFMKTPQVVSMFEAYSYGIAEHRRRLYPQDFLRLFSFVPPLSEQNEIAGHATEIHEKYESLCRKIEKEIELLREYRTRLISDVVTGQMDVRNVEIPDYIPEQDEVADAVNETDIGEVGADAE